MPCRIVASTLQYCSFYRAVLQPLPFSIVASTLQCCIILIFVSGSDDLQLRLYIILIFVRGSVDL